MVKTLFHYFIYFVLLNEKGEIEFSEEQLKEFAHFLFDEMREFYRSSEGQEYYKEWIKCHPEYAEAEKTA